MAKVKKPKKDDKERELPDIPNMFLELAVEASVTSKVVADKTGLRAVNSLTFVTPDMTSEQLSSVLAQLDVCLDDNGIVRVGVYPRSDAEAEDGEEGQDDNKGE